MLKLRIQFIGVVFFSVLGSGVWTPEAATASDDTHFTEGPVEQAIGLYSNGSLTNAMSVPNQGEGFKKVFVSRDRGWSTYDLQAVLAKVSHDVKAQYAGKVERLQIGDMSLRNGGFVGRHSSHQNGLDADIAYLRTNRSEQRVEHNGWAERFVINGELTPNFDVQRNWELMRKFVATGRVTRIFVDSAIKKAFCEYTSAIGTRAAETETLRILRVWPHHHDHLHVRLSCPKNSPRCVSQHEPPTGDGCVELDTALWAQPSVEFSPFTNEPGFDD